MKTYKLLLTPVELEYKWGIEPKDAVKCGIVAFPFKGKTDDYDFDLKKGEKIYYQHGTHANFDGIDYVLVSLTQLVCQK